MKAVIVIVTVLSFTAGIVQPYLGYWFVIIATAFFLVYGVLRNLRNSLPSLHDLPNTLRVFLAALGGSLLSTRSSFIFPSAGALCIFASILLSDNYQRSVLAVVRGGKMGGTVALLGIDGSGKSTHADALERWFEERGYQCSNVPFHKYIFVEALARKPRGDLSSKGTRRGGNPLRPLLSLVDNLLLHTATAFGAGFGGRVIIYDRYIWSTYVKYKALGYPVRPLSRLYLLPKPTCAIVLDVPVSKSLDVIGTRSTHIRYRAGVLSEEREEYLRIARNRRYPIVDATNNFSYVQAEIERQLMERFPGRGKDGGAIH